MAMQIKNLYVPLPHCFTTKDFMDGHSLTPNRTAVVQLLDGNLNLCQIILFTLHNVLPIPPLSTRYSQRQRPVLASCESPRAF